MHVIRVNEERCDGCVAGVLQGNWRSGKELIGIPAVEQIVGHGLTDHERLTIHVVGPEIATEPIPVGTGELPAWCNVYDGASAEEIAAVEKSIVRCDVSRSFE